MNRSRQILKVSFCGIITNIVLVVFKMIVGLISNSIAIILDAVNNLSDVLSSVITIIGTKLAGKKPDKEHPYGHGRIEYFASIIISLIILAAGAVALKESVSKIINPVSANYTVFSLLVIIVGIVTKIILGRYVKDQGVKLNSKSLIASGIDALGDAFIALTTLAAAIIKITFNVNTEGYFGIFISIVIIKSAIEILKNSIDDMIGVRADSELTDNIKNLINSYSEVLGVYDLTIHNYGPNKIIATAHIQVDDNMNAREIHHLTHKITLDTYKKYGIVITIGIYASNDQEEYRDVKNYINDLAKDYPCIMQVHGFYVDEDTKQISFDAIISFEEKDPYKVLNEINKKLKEKYPEYNFSIILDMDITD